MSVSSASLLSIKEDSVLVDLARNGDESALSILLSRYEPYIKSCCSVYVRFGIDFEDLLQEGRIGLVSAVKLFRCDAGASFKTYVSLCIKRQIVSAVRNAASGKNIPMNTYVPLEDIDKSGECSEPFVNPEEMVIGKEQLSAVKSALNGMFSSNERKIFSMYLCGYSYKSIAETMDIEVKQVDNSLQRVKHKLSLIFS